MNPYLLKLAYRLTAQDKRDLSNSAVVAGLGAGGNVVADVIIHPKSKGRGKAALIGAWFGFSTDLAGTRLNRKINEKIKDVENV
jgi:hypothetical protein